MRKLLTVAALIGFTVLTVPGTAGAACAPTNTSERLGTSHVVFVGTVTAVENKDRTATFDVQWVWKGTGVQETVTVHGGSTDAAVVSPDDREFQVGITYLVASSSPVPPYKADECTGTRPWTIRGSAIPPNYQNAVGATNGVAPDPAVIVEAGSNVLDSPLVPFVAGAMVVTGLIFAISRVFRGPERVERKGSKRRAGRGRRSRLPTVGRSREGISGGLRRSGVSQAQKLRGIRHGKSGRKSSKKARSKTKTRGLRTDRLGKSREIDSRVDA